MIYLYKPYELNMNAGFSKTANEREHKRTMTKELYQVWRS